MKVSAIAAAAAILVTSLAANAGELGTDPAMCKKWVERTDKDFARCAHGCTAEHLITFGESYGFLMICGMDGDKAAMHEWRRIEKEAESIAGEAA